MRNLALRQEDAELGVMANRNAQVMHWALELSTMSASRNSSTSEGDPECAEDIPKSQTQKRNAFAELMAPKPKQAKPYPSTTHPAVRHNPYNRRTDLILYINNPESHPPSRVISYNSSFVLINDAFPKATIHLLLLPRDPSKLLMNPRTALSTDPAFLAAVRAEASAAAALAAKELARRLGDYSATELARTAAMDSAMDSASDPDLTDLPPARDYLSSIRIGVHAHPSMSHLHIHILSCDMHSPFMKHRKHYNSFTTPFLIPLDAFPLAKDDIRWQRSYQNANLRKDFVCWRCGKGFGSQFKQLKQHLEDAFEEWRSE